MVYSIKRLKGEGDFRLHNLDQVESLQIFWSEVNMVKRLWIDDLQVFATIDGSIQSDDERITCDLLMENSERLFFCGKRRSVTNVATRVFCLPDSSDERVLILAGNRCKPGEERDELLLTPQQMRQIIFAHPCRQFVFICLTLSPEQSIELVAHRTTAMIEVSLCVVTDGGKALVNWLENINDSRTLGCFTLSQTNIDKRLLAFLNRATYPVFQRLALSRHDNAGRIVALSTANISCIPFHIDSSSKCRNGPLLQALRDGSYRPPCLQVCLETSNRYDCPYNEFIMMRKIAVFFNALKSEDCSLLQLQISIEDQYLMEIAPQFELHLRQMLEENNSLEILSIHNVGKPLSIVECLHFPQMGILVAAAAHPRLQKINVTPPLDDPCPEVLNEIHEAFPYEIRFHEGGQFYLTEQRDKWQLALFLSSPFVRRFERLHTLANDRVRTFLLAQALATSSMSPKRVFFLLRGSQDLLAR